MRCSGGIIATLTHEGNYNLVGKTSFRTMDTEPARLRKHFDNAHTVALADVFHEGFHAQYIFEIYEELIIGFCQEHEARHSHSCAPLVDFSETFNVALADKFLDFVFGQPPASGSKYDALQHHSGQK